VVALLVPSAAESILLFKTPPLILMARLSLNLLLLVMTVAVVFLPVVHGEDVVGTVSYSA
jgi:hypothetical protein